MEENKYKAALERAKSAIKECGDNIGRIRMIESIFPELGESEDEQTRKQLLDLVHRYTLAPYNDRNRWVAYLEKVKDFDKKLEEAFKNSDEVQYKRGYDDGYVEGMADAKQEQLTASKDERKIREACYEWDAEKKELKKLDNSAQICKNSPKFKVGDWVVNKHGSAFLIAYIDEENQRYVFEIGGYTKEQMNYENIEFADTHYHLWSISDAKDGDMIICEGCEYLLFKSFSSTDKRIKLHCWYNGQTNNFRLSADVKLEQEASILPATKIQRNILFAKMEEAGYAWNPITKELSQISVKKSDKVWSEEDDKILCGVIDEMQANKSSAPEYDLKTYDKFLSWLKSIKDRIQPQPKQGGKWKWEEDDEKFFRENIIVELGNIDEVSPELYRKIIDWIDLIKKRLL